MDNKGYILLEKIYLELQEMKAEVRCNNYRLMRLENDVRDKLGALIDVLRK